MNALSFGPFLDGYWDARPAVAENLRRRAQDALRRRAAEKAAIGSVAEFERYREQQRSYFVDALGGIPCGFGAPVPRRGPVSLRRGFTVQPIQFESQPDFPVTAALYRPAVPSIEGGAVLFLLGHADEGKACPEYVAVCADLARNGLVVLAIDPPGQGERSQWIDPATGLPALRGCTREHTHAGLTFFAAGASLARQFVADALAGFELLVNEPAVDPSRIGVTGNSGGGLQCCFLMLAEPRLAAAMPCTFPMTLESYLATGQPQDAEQIVWSAMARGPDHDDYLTALAPKPVRIGAVDSDFFPIEGTREALDRARRIYHLYSETTAIDLVVDAATHAYTPALRSAAVEFFSRHLLGREPEVTGPLDDLPRAEELRSTRSGQVVIDRPECRTVFTLSGNVSNSRKPPEHNGETARSALAARLGISHASGIDTPIDVRRIASGTENGMRWERLFFFTEPGVPVSGLWVGPAEASTDTAPPTDLLLLPDGTSSVDDPSMRPSIVSYVTSGHAALIFDVRGTGGVRAREINGYGRNAPHGTEYRMAMDAAMLGLSLMGLRVYDLLRGVEYLSRGRSVRDLGVRAFGTAGLIGLYAAALDERITRVTCSGTVASYRLLAGRTDYDPDLINYATTPWGIELGSDPTDLAPMLRGRSVRFACPLDVDGSILDEDSWRGLFPEKDRDAWSYSSREEDAWAD